MAKYKMSVRDTAIYEYILQKHPRPVEAKELVRETGKSHQSIYRGLTRLADNNKIKRKPGRGNSYSYSIPPPNSEETIVQYPTYERGTRNTDYSQNPATPVGPQKLSLKAGQLDSLVLPWSSDQWKPKVIESAKNLPRGLARLYELAYEAAYGGMIEKSDLDSPKIDIMQLYADLETTMNVVSAIVNTKALWDPAKFAQFIMANDKSPEFYLEIAQGIRRKN